MVDCAARRREQGVEGDVSMPASPRRFRGSTGRRWPVTMAERVRRHGVRRAEEMREAGARCCATSALDPALAPPWPMRRALRAQARMRPCKPAFAAC